MKYLLDTHTWVCWNMRPQNLSRKVKKLIENTNGYDELLLSAISPWEFSKLLEKRRIKTQPLISSVVDLEELPNAMKEFASPKRVKTLVRIGQD